MKRKIFLLGYYLKRPEVVRAYKEIKALENKKLETLKEYQSTKLIELISYAVKEVPYYTDLFKTLNLLPEDIKSTEDLIKLPILTKEMIKKDPESFIAKNYKGKVVNGSTGGSTGIPLKYKMSDEDYSRGVALLFRGFGFGGFDLGDSMSIIAGASLTSKNQSLKSKVQDRIMNFNHFSSYGMSEKEFHNYYKYLNDKKPMFLRGYASSLFLLAKYLKQNKLALNYQLQAIYSTAEKLLPKQRMIIESVFNTSVFDNYGLNDGGVSAYECEIHNGMHIDFERSILEVVDENGEKQLIGQRGKILATSLFNYTMPFIRYDTGDLGVISDEKCRCGCPRPLLREISGRVTDYLKVNGVYIGGPVLTVLMGKVDTDYYQIVQTGINRIEINLIPGELFGPSDESFIRKSLNEHVDNIIVKFNYLSSSHVSLENDKKHKFIINNDFK